MFKPLKYQSLCVLVENSEVQLENRFFWLIRLKMDASLDRGKPGTVRNVSRQEGREVMPAAETQRIQLCF